MKKTLKKSMSWLLVLAMLFSLCAAMSFGVSAASVSLGKAGDNIEAYYDSDTKTLSLVGSGPMYDYVEDGEVGLYNAIKARPWDAYSSQIKTVSFSGNITTIGNAAFYNLTSLNSCTIPSSVVTIGEWSFGRTAMTSVVIPASTQLIKHFAFYSSALTTDAQNSICLGATTIENEHITGIYDGQITGATQTTNYELVNDLKNSGSVIIEASGTVPAGIKWTYSTQTKTLKLTYDGTGVATMVDMTSARPWDAYMYEIQTVEIGDNIGNIGAYAFVGASNLRSVNLTQANDLAKIGTYAFAGCTALTNLSLPRATLTIESMAFSSRGTNITVTTPNAKTTMDAGNACANDAYVIWNYGTETPTPGNPSGGQNGSLTGGVTWTYSSGVLILTATQANAAIPDYTSYAQTPWAQAGLTNSIGVVIIGSNITSIGQNAFAYLPNLNTVTIGQNVLVIGQGAFAYSSGLRSIDFPASVVYIDANAFLGSGLVSATKQNASMIVNNPNTELINALNNTGSSGTPNGTQGGTISDSLSWSYDPTTRRLTISGTGAIPDYASSLSTPWGIAGLNSQISSILIGSTVTAIGNYAFSNLTALSSVTIGSGVQTIGQYAFAYDTALTSISLPASVATVKAFAFYGCTALSTATKANAAMVIHDPNNELKNALNSQSTSGDSSGLISGTALAWTYYATTNTLSISGTGAIPDYTNYALTPWSQKGLNPQIKAIYISTGVTEIGNWAFAHMPLLSVVGIGSRVTNIGQYAFANDTALTSIAIPASVATVEGYAFSGCTALSTASKANASMVIGTPNTELLSALNQQSGSGTETPPTSGTDAEGYFANNLLKWEYKANNNRLMIYPVGTNTKVAIPDFTTTNAAPWSIYSGSITNLIISYDITGIGNYAFANMPYLQSVTIGEDVATIGTGAFYNDIRLGSIVFPEKVTLVEPNAFTGCSSLYSATKKNVNMVVSTPNTELLRVLGTSSNPDTPNNPGSSGSTITGTIDGTLLTWSYDQTTNALNITGSGAIPNYTTTSPAPWNSYASAIKAITIHTGVTAIGNYAFAGITQVVDLYIPDTVTTIGNEAFAGCIALQTIRMPQTLTSLGSGAFRSCSSLKSIDIPDRITAIGDYTFRDCTSLESVELPTNLLSIGIEAFYGCTSLQSVDLPRSLFTIGARAFYGCINLKDVIFRSSNLTIDVDAFGTCTNLQKAVYESNPPTTATGNQLLISKYIARYSSNSSGNISWMADRAEGTLTISGTGEVTSSTAWKSELSYVDTLVFGNGITGIGADLLKNDRNIVRVEMADSVTTIGAGAFEGCTHLQSVSLSNNISTVGERAFYGCTALTVVTLPDSLKTIPKSAFANCYALASVNMGKNTMMIGQDAFSGCMSLDNLVLPASLRVISTGAFNDCYALTNLEMYGGNINDLTVNTFDNCTSLHSVRFHGSKAEWDKMVLNADPEIAGATVTYYVELTVNHVYKGGPLNGQTVTVADTFSGVAGASVTISAKTCDAHYMADDFTATVTLGSENSELTITYSPKLYTLTIHCVDAKTGKIIAQLESQKVAYASSFEGKAAPIEGYTVVDDRIYVESMTGDYTYTVEYNKNVYTYTVEYLNTQTNKVFATKEYQAEHGSTVVAETPEMTGYTLVSGTYKIDELTKNGEKITVKYRPEQKTLTIEYVDKEGNKLYENKTLSVYYGEQVNVASPVIEGKAPDQEIVTLESYNGESKITVTYDWRYYTVTIRFIEKDSYGYEIRPAYVKSVKHGDPFTFAMDSSYYEDAYVIDKETVTYASVTADITETIIYSPRPLKLTIEYRNVDGKLLGTAEQTVYAGKSYTVEEHTIKGYLQTEEPVSGTMGTEDKTITIELEKDPDARGGAGKVIAVVVIILLVLGTGGTLFYFLYLKKKPY